MYENLLRTLRSCPDAEYGCSNCRTIYANGGWQFKGCYYKPYRGKWVVEIKDCPKKEE